MHCDAAVFDHSLHDKFVAWRFFLDQFSDGWLESWVIDFVKNHTEARVIYLKMYDRPQVA